MQAREVEVISSHAIQGTLKISQRIKLPLDFVTQTVAIFGRRGSGKTTTAIVLAEEMLRENQQVIIVDPLDVAWGLRGSRDGSAAGLPITVLGGDHADLPLEATAGATIAEFLVEHSVPAILSLRHFSMNDQRRFVTDFAERLYHLKGKSENRRAVHLILDECDEFAPQKLQPGHQRMFGAIDRLVRRGRAAGIGVTMISQRPAVVNKDILSQAELLVCHQTTSPQDRKALEAWIAAHDVHNQRAHFMDSLASLERGEAWFWSPGWLDLFVRVNVRDRTTFDSSATPKAGARQVTPEKLAPVDLDDLRRRMQDSISKAEQNDPAALRRRIAELEKAAGKHSPEEVLKARNVGYAQGRAECEQTIRTLQQALKEINAELTNLHDVTQRIHASAGVGFTPTTTAPRPPIDDTLRLLVGPTRPILAKSAMGGVNKALHGEVRFERDHSRNEPAIGPIGQVEPRSTPKPIIARVSGGIGSGVRRMLIALAQRPKGLDSRQLGLRSQLSSRSGTFSTYLSQLRGSGQIETTDGRHQITELGLEALGKWEPLPEGPALLEYWCGELPAGAAGMLRAVASLYPGSTTAAEIGEIAGLSHKSGTFSTYMSKLRTLELVTKDGPAIRLSEELA
jgi:DNA polymerase III delta prime subunit